MRNESYDFMFSKERNQHEEVADGHCLSCGDGFCFNLYCY
jgi:hypothetical protein